MSIGGKGGAQKESSGLIGWRADPWIEELARGLLLKTDQPQKINRKSKRDEVLWHRGQDRLDEARAFLKRWLLTGEIELLAAGTIDEIELHGLLIQLKDEDQVRNAFRIFKKEESYRSKTIMALKEQGLSDDFISDIAPCVLSASLSPECVAKGIKKLQEGRFLSKRSASAQCFKGDSKFLDGRDVLLEKTGQSALKSSPLIINVKLPAQLKDVLFIENLDTFTLFCEQDRFEDSGTALVYSKGFAASAIRLKNPAGRRLFIAGSKEQEGLFNSFLNGTLELPVSLFGDLDWAGLAIYQALLKNIPNLTLWEEGYAVLVQELVRGGGHRPDEARKSGQSALAIETFTNPLVIKMASLLASEGRFVDQELFT